MPRIVIDNRQIEVEPGATVLDAARRLGVAIPTLCHLAGHPPATSCMVCVVRVNGGERLVPACATTVADGMLVESDTDDVREARRAALELLLSDHLGDCEAPCRSACPAHMDIPLMIRQIAAGDLGEAIKTVKRHIALPAVLGRVCPAPCEKACRRGAVDKPVSICLLKRYAADADSESGHPYLPTCSRRTGRKVAIIGAGPAGLAAAWHLLQEGHSCTVFDDRSEPGGMLRGIDDGRLPATVLDAEIDAIMRLGTDYRRRSRVGREITFQELRAAFDAVLIAAGQLQKPDAAAFGVEYAEKGLRVDRHTLQTTTLGVFAAGSAVVPSRLAVRAVADGRAAAVAISQYLAGAEVTGEPRTFSVHAGKLSPEEMARFAAGMARELRVQPAGISGHARHGGLPGGGAAEVGEAAGFSRDEALREASRCLHCDCRKKDACTLRDHACEYDARPGAHKGERRSFTHDASHPAVIYEPGKCISCGICVRITAAAKEPLGLTFIGRGFGVRVAVPFGRSLADGLQTAARECVAACPTGALAFKNGARAPSSGKD